MILSLQSRRPYLPAVLLITMATAAAPTFEDSQPKHVSQDIQLAFRPDQTRPAPQLLQALPGAPKDDSDTLIDVNNDPVRRNKLASALSVSSIVNRSC